jgi:hypothetical protein
MRRGSSAVLFVLLAATGAACGGETFADEYNRAVRPLSALGQRPEVESRNFDRIAGRTERARANLARLDAPQEVQGELERLLASLEAVTRDLNAVAEASRSEDRESRLRAARRLVESSGQVRRAERALARVVEGKSGY